VEAPIALKTGRIGIKRIIRIGITTNFFNISLLSPLNLQ